MVRICQSHVLVAGSTDQAALGRVAGGAVGQAALSRCLSEEGSGCD